MFRSNLTKLTIRFAFLFLSVSTLSQPGALHAQAGETLQQLKERVSELVKQQKYTEALPLLEKLLIAEPNDPEAHFYLGFALIAQANITKEETGAKALRVRARNAFIKSKELGIKEPIIDALIQSVPPDGSRASAFSQNPEADRLMTEAEALFSQGKLDDALKNYQRALELDPKLYFAALFSGDVYTQRGDFQHAETWYQKAIAINPNQETAYRYSATPLMKQGKYEQARDRYVEAYITEPYGRYSVAGLTQWAQVTNTKLGHPEIDMPTNITLDEKGDAKINVDSAILDGKEDGGQAWLAYGAARSTWRKQRFAVTFPNEKTYRHSLAEETDALRSVLAIATGDKTVKKLTPSLEMLKKLNDAGLLEAYILLAKADEGIAVDHPAYLRQNRDKLRRYVVEYVLTNGGK